VPLPASGDVSLIVRGRLCNVQQLCVGSMLHGSKTWPLRKENNMALQQTEMRMVRWICGIKLQDRVLTKGLRKRLGLHDIVLVLQQGKLRWYGCEL